MFFLDATKLSQRKPFGDCCAKLLRNDTTTIARTQT
jgi:hypothetical protein